MQVLLLLTIDPGLEREVEVTLEELSCIPVGSLEEATSMAKQFDPSPVLLVDTTTFPPPQDSAFKAVLCVGEEICPGFPLVERPLRPKEVQALLKLSTRSISDRNSGGSTALLPSPYGEFQRDAVHDLKNQLTTILGNLMLFQEEIDGQGIEDMTLASNKALQLTEWLEVFGSGDFSTQDIDLHELIQDLLPFFHRLVDRKVTFTLHDEKPSCVLHADLRSLLALILNLVQAIPREQQTCLFSLPSTEKGVRVVCSWDKTEQEMTCPEGLKPLAATCNVKMNISSSSWELCS